MASLTRVVRDTSTLEAICKTDFSEPVFEHLPLCTTDVCFEELRRNKSSTDDYRRQQAVGRVFDHRSRFGTPTVVPTPMAYEPYVDDQGERSIVRALRSAESDDVRYILLFDFSAAEDVEAVIDPGTTEVNTPGRAFELVWQGGFIPESDHHRALRQLADREGWQGKALVDALPRTEYEDVF